MAGRTGETEHVSNRPFKLPTHKNVPAERDLRDKIVTLDPNPRILIIARQGLGDALFLFPMLDHLRAKLPYARIDLLVDQKGAEQVFRHNPSWDNLLVIRPGILGCAVRQLVETRRTRYHVALVEFPSGNRSALIAWLLGIPVRVGHWLGGWYAGTGLFLTHMLEPNWQIHRVANNLNLLEPLGLYREGAERPKIRFTLRDDDREGAERFLTVHEISKPFLGLHPGSKALVVAERRWPVEKYVELARRLCSEWNFHILVFGGKEEESEVTKIAASLDGRGTAVLCQPLALVAGLMDRCSLFVAGDSGPLHLANALGIPVVGVYGPTDPAQTGPFNPGGIVVRTGIECSPCFKFSPFFHCIRETNLCLQNLDVRSVFGACVALLENSKSSREANVQGASERIKVSHARS